MKRLPGLCGSIAFRRFAGNFLDVGMALAADESVAEESGLKSHTEAWQRYYA